MSQTFRFDGEIRPLRTSELDTSALFRVVAICIIAAVLFLPVVELSKETKTDAACRLQSQIELLSSGDFQYSF